MKSAVGVVAVEVNEEVRALDPAPQCEVHFCLSPPGLATGLRRLSAGEDPLGGTAVPVKVMDILRRRRGSGQALPGYIAGSMGEQLGVDLTSVRVHTDSESQTVSRSLQATAFTHGSDIYFGPGAFNPGSTSGQRVLAHELAHVAQQARGSAIPSPAVVGRADDPAEAEAESIAKTMVLRRQAETTHPTGWWAQRRGDGGHLDLLRRQSQPSVQWGVVPAGIVPREGRHSRGNGAITGAPRGLTRGTVSPAVIRRSVFWDETVDPAIVDGITLDRIGSTGGGAHTTAYQLFIETVQNAVVGVTYATGIDRLKALAKDVKDLPGWVDTRDQIKLWDAFEDDFDSADDLRAKVSANHSYFLETLATDYFKMRNSCWYNYHQGGEGALGSANEPRHLKLASAAYQAVDWGTITADLPNPHPNHTEAKNQQGFGAFIQSASDLLDTRNVKRPAKKPQQKDWVKRWVRIIKQHIASIIVAHPGVEASADLIIEHLVEKLGLAIGLLAAERKDIKTAMNGMPNQGWSNIEAAN